MLELLQQFLSSEYLAHSAAVASVLIFVVLFLYWWGTRGFADLKKLNVPGPKPIPFYGNFLEVRKYNGLHEMHLDYIKKYGKVLAICLGSRPSLVVADPELLKQIMVKDFPNFQNRFQVQQLSKLFSKTVLNARDGTWKRIRNTLTPTFSAGKMKLMVPLMETSCDTLMEKLEKIVDSGQSVDMLDWFGKLTLEVILSTAFGVDANVQKGENTVMLKEAKKLFQTPLLLRQIARLPFGKAFLRLIRVLLGGFRPEYFGDVATEIIKKRRQQGFSGRKDLLDLMMNATDETTTEGVTRLSDDEVVSQCIIFLLAGYETSSNTLAFTVYQLVVNPDVQDKLRAEIRDAYDTNSRKKSLFEIAQNIEYLDCVIKESQRLYPPVAIVNRECHEDYDLNGIHIPAGTEVVIPIYALHHDPDAWEDPEKFDPERFRGARKDTRHPFQFLPFGAGPRNCIGMRFALLEIKVALVKILMKYKFVRSPETQVPVVLHPGATLSAKNGVLIRVEYVL